jgi:hypothetical protein
MDIIAGIFQGLDIFVSLGLRSDRKKDCKKNKGKWSSISGCKYNDKKTKTKKKKGGTKRKRKRKI